MTRAYISRFLPLIIASEYEAEQRKKDRQEGRKDDPSIHAADVTLPYTCPGKIARSEQSWLLQQELLKKTHL